MHTGPSWLQMALQQWYQSLCAVQRYQSSLFHNLLAAEIARYGKSWPGQKCQSVWCLCLLLCCGAALLWDYLAVKQCGVFIASYLELHISFWSSASSGFRLSFFFFDLFAVGLEKQKIPPLLLKEWNSVFLCFRTCNSTQDNSDVTPKNHFWWKRLPSSVAWLGRVCPGCCREGNLFWENDEARYKESEGKRSKG